MEVSGDSSVSSWSGATVAEAAARLAAVPRLRPALSPTAEALLASLGGGGDVFRRPGGASRLTTWSTASLGDSSGHGEVQGRKATLPSKSPNPGELAALPPIRRPELRQAARRERGGQEARLLHMIDARRQQMQEEHRAEGPRVEERAEEDITYEQFTEQ